MEDIATGERRTVARIRSVCMAHAASYVLAEDVPELARLWAMSCRRRCPGKVWRWFVGLYQDGARAVGEAWRLAWAMDAEGLRIACQRCGSQTFEVVVDLPGEGRFVRYQRDRCRTTRCAHCGVKIVAPRWKARLLAQAVFDRDAGSPWLWATITLRPQTWCEGHGVPFDGASAVLCQRWIGERFGELVQDLREFWPDLEYYRALELHDSQWPHLHVCFRGGMVTDAQLEARALGRGATWAGVAAYSRDQFEKRDRGELRYARCPFPELRKVLKLKLAEHAFGAVLDVRPVDWERLDEFLPYATKGPLAHGAAQRLEDPVEALAGEMAKPRQRAGRLLARGVRAFEASRRTPTRPGFFSASPRPPREPVEGIVSVRRFNAPLDRVLELLGDDQVTGAHIVTDFSGPVPDVGGRRPTILEGFFAIESAVDRLRLDAEVTRLEREPRLLDTAPEFWTDHRRPRAGPRGPAPDDPF